MSQTFNILHVIIRLRKYFWITMFYKFPHILHLHLLQIAFVKANKMIIIPKESGYNIQQRHPDTSSFGCEKIFILSPLFSLWGLSLGRWVPPAQYEQLSGPYPQGQFAPSFVKMCYRVSKTLLHQVNSLIYHLKHSSPF